MALSWEMIEFDNKSLEVRCSYSLKDRAGIQIIKKPKTRVGRRIVEIGATLATALYRHRKKQLERNIVSGANWHNDLNIVCTQDDDSPISSRAIGHFFRRRDRTLGYEVSFHGLRHTHVSMMIKAEVPINAIFARVGHSNPSITHDIYSHLLLGMGRSAVDLFEIMLTKQTVQTL